MSEREKFNTNQEFLAELAIGERPLIDQWVKDCLPVFQVRNNLVRDLLSGSVQQDNGTSVFQNGIRAPAFLVPIMELWARRGPTILCSYSHPEEFNLYKFMGRLNLILFLTRMKTAGIEIPSKKITENWYETVALTRSVTEPLNFGDFFPADKFKPNLLGLAGRKRGSEMLDRKKQLEVLESIPISGIAQKIVDHVQNDIDETIKSTMPDLTRRKRYEMRQVTIRNIVSQRISEIINIAKSVLESGVDRLTINEFLTELEQRFAGMILNDKVRYGLPPRIDELTEIKGSLSSKNKDYLDLVMDTLVLLIEAKGVDVLRGLVNSTGEGLFLGLVRGKNVTLTIDKDANAFILMNDRTGEIEQRIPDAEIIELIRNNDLVPLAKSETLALVASGMVFHMGSEYGNRNRALLVLELETTEYSAFKQYLSNLRIGQDLEQGNGLFSLNGTKLIPAILAFVLLGKDFIRSEMIKEAGINNQPLTLSIQELKKLTAESLVKSLKTTQRSAFGSGPEVMHAGYLWG